MSLQVTGLSMLEASDKYLPAMLSESSDFDAEHRFWVLLVGGSCFAGTAPAAAPAAAAAVAPCCCASERLLQGWQEWRAKLSDAMRCALRGGATKESVTLSFVCQHPVFHETLARAIDWLAGQAEVLWIERQRSVHPQIRFARYAILDNFESFAEATNSSSPTAQRLHGEGEILGMSDTGLNTDVCYFYDAALPIVPQNVPIVGHRKLLLYDTEYGDYNDVQGHGSFCASAAVGQCWNASSVAALYNGIAPEAMMAFVDIAIGEGGLNLPTPVSDIYEKTYKAGARIESDSWGGQPFAVYAVPTRDVDDWLLRHPDFLLFYATGNDGAYAYSTVTAEATTKNAVAVGATYTYFDGELAGVSFFDGTTAYSYLVNTSSEMDHLLSLCALNPDVYCGPSINQTLWCEDPLLSDVLCGDKVREQVLANASRYRPQSIESFSSKGPTYDGRTKPDMCAPGGLLTGAYSHSATTGEPITPDNPKVALVSGSGTSFATPLTAASALLVRQYLREGYYPSGSKRAGDAIAAPRASLIKALLINSAQPLNGSMLYQNRWVSLPPADSPSPSPEFHPVYGFGRVALDEVLAFPESSHVLWIASAEDRSIDTNQVHAFCYSNGPNDGQVRVTLTWLDEAGLPFLAKPLVTDLDLHVVITSSEAELHAEQAGPGLRGNGFEDTVNTVERVRAPIAAGDWLKLTVTGAAVGAQHRQAYSLVITGPLGFVPERGAQCRECNTGASVACFVEHGLGEASCHHGRWGTCVVSACQLGYIVSSWTNSCVAFTAQYVIIAASAGFFVILVILVHATLASAYACKRGKLSKRTPGEPVGFWDLYAVFRLRRTMNVFAAILDTIGAAVGILQPWYIGVLLQELVTAATLRTWRSHSRGSLRPLWCNWCAHFGNVLTSLSGAWILSDLRLLIYQGLLKRSICGACLRR